MRYLTYTEILKLEKKLENSDLVIESVLDQQYKLNIRIKTLTRSNNGFGYPEYSLPEFIDPIVKYDFIFSVSSNRKEFFFDILSRLLQVGFGTKIIISPIDRRDYKLGNVELKEIKIDTEVVESTQIYEHSISDKNYVRYTYHFSGRLSSILAYITYLEDAIIFFQKIWGYDESGKEYQLLKFNIGSVVSKINDKSKDFLIFDYCFKILPDDYIIDYTGCEILNNGTIITYGNSETLYENEICFSRDNRLGDILN